MPVFCFIRDVVKSLRSADSESPPPRHSDTRTEYRAVDASGRRKYLNEGENRRFLAASKSLPTEQKALCLTLYYTGCRISEALTLTSAQIDCGSHILHIRTLKQRRECDPRRVPIPSSLTRLLNSVADQDEGLWTFSRSTAWRIIKRVMKKAKIEGLHASPKGLRHGFGVRAAMARVPISKIQEWMGHADPTNTAIYLDVMDKEERELMKRTWKS